MAERGPIQMLERGSDGVERGNLLRELVEALGGQTIGRAAAVSAVAGMP